MTSTTLQLRIDKKTKSNAQKIIQSMGLDLSSAVKIFLTQVIVSNSIPFLIRTQNGFTSDYEKTLIKESILATTRKSKENNYGKGFKNGREAINSALS